MAITEALENFEVSLSGQSLVESDSSNATKSAFKCCDVRSKKAESVVVVFRYILRSANEKVDSLAKQ